MIYNSNGNNTPYQSGGNAKVQKELKALQEAINLVDANFNNYVDENDEDIVRIDNNIDAIELSVSGIGTRLSTAEGKLAGYDTLVETDKVQAQDADFHNVVAGKYVFQNGAAITGTNICKIADGSVVYATDGTNAILIDYTDKDAWVAKAKVEDNQYFRIYSNGVLTFTQSGGWNVYVIGNDFSTDDFSIPQVPANNNSSGSLDNGGLQPIGGFDSLPGLIDGGPSLPVDDSNAELVSETPIEIITGVTIGGTLYAALARDYEFDNITVTSATINSATVTLLTAPSATITDLTATNETVADLTVTDEADINGLVNAKRNIQDEINGKISVDSHPTNVQVYIGVHKFTGTYSLKLTHEVNGAVQTLFTATIIWNGKYPIVQYHEYADNEPVDYLYSMVLTDGALYFVTQGAGNLYYSYDAMGGALAPTSSEYPNIPYQPNDVIADYITAYHDRTVFFGNHEDETGIDILGEMKADIVQLPDDFSITDLYIDNSLVVGGATTLTGDTTAGNITQDGNFSTTGKVEANKLYGTELGINDTGTDTPTTTYLSADENGVAVNVDTTITGDVNLTGDLTQTGDQNITGVVEISEKETINNLEPADVGYYASVIYYNLDGTDEYYQGSNTATDFHAAAPTGTLEGSRFTQASVVKYNNAFMGIQTAYAQIYLEVQGTGNRYTRNNEPYAPDTNGWIDHTETFSSVYNIYLPQPSDTALDQNRVYAKGGTNYYYVMGGSWSIQLQQVTSSTEIAALQNKTFVSATGACDYWRYPCYYTFSSEGYATSTRIVLTQQEIDEIKVLTPYSIKACTYREYVREIDPNHQYTPADEVLTVKGNEKVTRDLKVQGFIYQDEYNRAVLPNINANTINSNGGVLIIGELD